MRTVILMGCIIVATAINPQYEVGPYTAGFVKALLILVFFADIIDFNRKK